MVRSVIYFYFLTYSVYLKVYLKNIQLFKTRSKFKIKFNINYICSILYHAIKSTFNINYIKTIVGHRR